jgi:hypothetical protein
MAEFTPQIIPLGSLAEAAAAGADVAQQEQEQYTMCPSDPGTTCGFAAANP